MVSVHLPYLQTSQILFRSESPIYQDGTPRINVRRMVPHHRGIDTGIGRHILPLDRVGGSAHTTVVGMELSRRVVAVGVQCRGAGCRCGSVAAAGAEGDFGERVEYNPLYGVGVCGSVCLCAFGGGFVDEGNGGRVLDCGGCNIGVQVNERFLLR